MRRSTHSGPISGASGVWHVRSEGPVSEALTVPLLLPPGEADRSGETRTLPPLSRLRSLPGEAVSPLSLPPPLEDDDPPFARTMLLPIHAEAPAGSGARGESQALLAREAIGTAGVKSRDFPDGLASATQASITTTKPRRRTLM